MNDTLVALFACFAGAGTYTMTTRMLLPDGTLQNEVYVSQATPNPNVPWIVMPPVEGYLLSLVVTADTNIDGSQWCQVGVFRGNVATPLISLPPNSGMLIVQGYVDVQSWLSWPNSPIVEGGMGSGRMRSITPTTTTGANWSVTATALQRWEVVTVQATLTTSAVVANREMSLAWFDQTGAAICRFPAGAAQAAYTAVGYYFYDGAALATPAAGWVTAPIPPGLMLDPLMSLQSRVSGLDAGDAWSFVALGVREWMGVGHG